MKIMHIMLGNFYIDKYSYQENLLPKYHKKAGYDVKIVASLYTFDENGKGMWLPKAVNYMNEDGIPVSRLNFCKCFASRRFRKYIGLIDQLEDFKPDVIFIHGVQFSDISVIVKFLKKNKNVKVYVDNHADFSNSAQNWISRYILHRIVWRKCAQKINPYVTKFYGVLPSRVDFLINEYKVPANKVELLVMGADDEAVKTAKINGSREKIRGRYNISEEDFLIMYGGKTDNYKKQVFMLMDAVNAMKNKKVKLIVFGSVLEELKQEMEKRCSDRVQYIGWVLAADSYQYFEAADLAVFPGRHSVFWEQVVAQGIPLLVKYWEGTTHIDCGGNVKFLTQDSAEEIKDAIEEILSNDNYKNMLDSAQKASSEFMYSEIARRSMSK